MHLYLFRFTHPITGEEVGATSYAALMFVGAAAAILVVLAIGRRRRLPAFDLFAASLLAFAGGLVGARLLFLAVHGGELWGQGGFGSLLAPTGGLVWYGGAAGGLAAFVIYARGYGLPLRRMLDVGVVGAALGQAFGRLGCFAAGCCHGSTAPPGAPAVEFPSAGLAPAGVALHPVQLYEAGGLVILAAALGAWIWLREPRPAGLVAVAYVGGYATLRLLTEALRGDPRGPEILGLSLSQAVSVGLFFVAAALIAWTRRGWVASRQGRNDGSM